MTQVTLPKTSNVGLVDMSREGWYNNDTGEIYPGVPISVEDTVIDVGCGDGGHVSFCARRGAAVIMVDLDAVRLSTTEKRVQELASNECRSIVSDCNPIPLEEGTSDLTICTEVLEHVKDPSKFLQELVRVTRPGGKLLLSVPDSRSESLIAATAPEEYFKEPNHIRVFDDKSFAALAQDAGLEILQHNFQGCFSTFHLLLAWLSDTGENVVPADSPNLMTQHWAGLWKGVMQHQDGYKVREALNAILPKYQVIIARRKS